MIGEKRLLTNDIQKILNFASKFNDIINRTNEEFEKKGKFTKKLALMFFKKGSGMSIKDWLEYGSNLTKNLNDMDKFEETILDLKVKLNNFINYLKKAQESAKKFLKDPEELKETLERLESQEKLLNAFIKEIENL